MALILSKFDSLQNILYKYDFVIFLTICGSPFFCFFLQIEMYPFLKVQKITNIFLVVLLLANFLLAECPPVYMSVSMQGIVCK